mgnify:CR=1 FL=1
MKLLSELITGKGSVFIQGGKDSRFDQAQVGDVLKKWFPAENGDLTVFFADARNHREIDPVLAGGVMTRVGIVSEVHCETMAADTSSRPGEAGFFRQDTRDPCIVFTLAYEGLDTVPDGVLHGGVHEGRILRGKGERRTSLLTAPYLDSDTPRLQLSHAGCSPYTS